MAKKVDVINTSPVIKNKKIDQMSFPDAMIHLIAGKRISRYEWDDSDEFGQLRDGSLQIHTKGNYHSWLVNDGDLMAQDWLVLENKN